MTAIAARTLFVVTLLDVTAYGENTFLAGWQEVRNRQPDGVSLILSVPKATFFLGETIHVNLAFSTTKQETFLATPWADESFAIDPAALTDDLRQPRRTFTYSGPGPLFLSAEPCSVEVDLNESVRFRQPGVYRVSLPSG
jgi:hypothetical protein